MIAQLLSWTPEASVGPNDQDHLPVGYGDAGKQTTRRSRTAKICGKSGTAGSDRAGRRCRGEPARVGRR